MRAHILITLATLAGLIAGPVCAQVSEPSWPALLPARAVIANLHVVMPGVVRGGQPSDEGFNKLKEAGVRTVINLRNEDLIVARERQVVESLGMRYVNIPLDVFNPPSRAAVDQFLSKAGDSANMPVYVHCLHGQDRTGAMVAILRLHKQNWTAGQAYNEMLSLGFRPAFVNLSAAVYDEAARLGRTEARPPAQALVSDLRGRLDKLMGRLR